MSNPFSGRAASIVGPAKNFAEISPDDNNNIGLVPARSIYVGVGGVLYIQSISGSIVKLVSGDHQYHPITVVRVLRTGTTASDIIALY